MYSSFTDVLIYKYAHENIHYMGSVQKSYRTPSRQRAHFTAIGEQVLIALSAVLSILLHNIFISQQGLLAVMAVKPLCRHACSLPAGQRHKN